MQFNILPFFAERRCPLLYRFSDWSVEKNSLIALASHNISTDCSQNIHSAE